jgi:multiple sugar transport system substrate-binding protein
MTRIAWIVVAASAALLAGCPRNQQSQVAESGCAPATRASVALRVLVVNDPPLVEAVNRLRGEWAERSGGELNAVPTTWAELAHSKKIDADLIVFPSRYLGELCARELLRPVRSSVLEDEDLKFADIFSIVRNDLIKWNHETFALPLGIDPSAISPNLTSPDAITLLTVAAPQAISNERLGVLFDADTMKPRITDPAFVEALGKLPLLSKEGPREVSSSAAPIIPVLGENDRLVAVTASSRNAASAFKLLEWLALPETSSQFARIGGSWLAPRHSLATSASWFDASLTASDRADRGKKIEAALGGEQSLVLPRIPALDDYLAALDAAVKSAVVDKTPPSTALQTAADRWEQITNEQGRDKQRRAYLAHLGID